MRRVAPARLHHCHHVLRVVGAATFAACSANEQDVVVNIHASITGFEVTPGGQRAVVRLTNDGDQALIGRCGGDLEVLRADTWQVAGSTSVCPSTFEVLAAHSDKVVRAEADAIVHGDKLRFVPVAGAGASDVDTLAPSAVFIVP